jgi:hypothetical protein
VTTRSASIFRAVSGAYVVIGLVAIIALARAEPFEIGEGRFQGTVHELEVYDFKWWILSAASLAWLFPIAGVVAFASAKAAGLDRERLRAVVRELLEDKSIPVIVDVDTRLPIVVEGPLSVGVKLDTSISIDDKVEIDASIPLSVELPLDTEVSTSVFGLGHIKVPIKAKIPLNLTIPLHTSVRVRANHLPIHLEETAKVALPALDVPIKSRLETRVDLLKTLDYARQ